MSQRAIWVKAHLLGLPFGLALFLAACQMLSIPTTTVPGSLPERVEIGIGTVSPLPGDKARFVRITVEVASAAVLHHQRESGWPEDLKAMHPGGCVFLGWLEQRPMSMAPIPPPPSAVYLVGLVSAEGPGLPEMWVMVDATTGDVRSAFGMGDVGSAC